MKSYGFLFFLLFCTLVGEPAVWGLVSVESEEKEIPSFDGTLLSGTLVTPPQKAPYPLLIIIPGSGPIDRDGNSPVLPGKMNTYKMLADSLRKYGIATFRYDKRGVGKSTTEDFREDSLRFDHYWRDVVAIARSFRTDPRFSSVHLLGHSEGGLIALIAAQHLEEASSLVLVAPQPKRADSLILEQLERQGPMLVPAAEKILRSVRKGERVDSVPPIFFSLFRPSVQPYLFSWMQYEPREEISKVSLPILLICGETDIQITCESISALAEAAAAVRFVRIAEMNHVMKQVATQEMQQQQKSYTDPTVPLAPKLLHEIRLFLHDGQPK